MNIHPLWYVCLIIRISIIYFIKYIYDNHKNYKKFIEYILLIFGLGFIYQGFYGSNNETQISKVFWHDVRYVHGILYLLSYYYLSKNRINLSLLMILLEIIFSILYRIVLNR